MNVGGVMLAMQGALSQGILWGIMVLGVYITYKILNIADLTVDGSFALGGCICAMLVVTHGINPVVALVVATLAGVVAGAVTGFLHTVFEIPAILAGILTQIALWSINLRIMGRSNIPLLKVDTVVTKFMEMVGIKQSTATLIIGVFFAILAIIALYWFFGTEIGCALRATGNNEDMVRALGSNTKMTKMLALMLSNGLVGLSGALVCQNQKFADVGMGTGAIVIGLAAIVIGDMLLGKLRSFGSKLASAIVGSVVYFIIRAVVLQLGMDSNDMKLISAIMVALALCIPVAVDKWRIKSSYTKGGAY